MENVNVKEIIKKVEEKGFKLIFSNEQYNIVNEKYYIYYEFWGENNKRIIEIIADKNKEIEKLTVTITKR